MNEALTHSERNELKSMLEQSMDRLKSEIKSALEKSNNPQYAEMAGKVHDTGDDSVADLLSDLQYLTIDHLVREIRQTEGALQRIRTGEYGVCVDCGEAIVFARLRAEPATERCVDCQESFESRSV